MMNPAFDQIMAADDETRLGLFTTTAQRLGTTPQNVEKDFWVCWTLDALFNGLPDRPRLLFKGGTSLSKGFGLIKRFSEDIDVTVFRDDLGETASIEELKALSGKKRGKALDDIKTACETYINGRCLAGLSAIISESANRNEFNAGQFLIEPDPEDSQALYLRYPTATPVDTYITKAVKIESGAKSALDPNAERAIRPYLEDDVPDIDLSVGNVTTVDAQRTFWDKIVILRRRSGKRRCRIANWAPTASHMPACSSTVPTSTSRQRRPPHFPFVPKERCSTTFGATIAPCDLRRSSRVRCDR